MERFGVELTTRLIGISGDRIKAAVVVEPGAQDRAIEQRFLGAEALRDQHHGGASGVEAGQHPLGRLAVDIGQELGGRRYADWVVRSLTNPKHQVLCAVVDDQTAGLFIIEPEPNGSVYWHLTAVVPQWQGKGVGKAMWASMLLGHAVHGARRVHTTISARNVPVVNLYARLGWRFMECQMSYHWASARWLAKGG